MKIDKIVFDKIVSDKIVFDKIASFTAHMEITP